MSTSRVLARSVIYAPGVVALALSIALGIWLSYRQALQTEERHAAQIASEIVHRADQITGQIDDATKALLQSNSPPCSPAKISLMRNIAIAGSYLQAVGYVKDNHLMCWSYGNLGDGMIIGPPEYLGKHGYWVRREVSLPSGHGTKFLFITDAKSGYTSIVLPDLVLDVGHGENDITTALVATTKPIIIFGRGQLDVTRIPPFVNGLSTITWFNKQHLGAAKQSWFGYKGVVLLPSQWVHLAMWQMLRWVLPVTGLVGLAFGFLTYIWMQQRASLSSQLAHAIRERELFLLYMPIVDLKTRKWVGMEALVRWNHPSNEPTGPDAFIPIAERDGLIRRLTQQVLELFVEDSRHHFSRYRDLYVAINVSARDFGDPAMIEELRRLSDASQHSFLVIEVTESSLIDAEQARSSLARLHEIGIRVAIDDFGTGYSSLSYLDTFKADMLKIDKSFVASIGTESVTSHVIDHIVELANDRRLVIVAEGVESDTQAAYLSARGVQFGQGWLFGKPMRAKEVVAELQKSGHRDFDRRAWKKGDVPN